MVVGPATRRIDEKWKRINRFSGYEVSNLGRVRNRKTGYVLRPYLNSHKVGEDYYRVNLVNARGRRKAFYVHRLVALYHVPGRSRSRCFVHHVNEDHHQNDADNLRWVTWLEHLILHGRATPQPSIEELCPF